jgi:hypothetical protein
MRGAQKMTEGTNWALPGGQEPAATTPAFAPPGPPVPPQPAAASFAPPSPSAAPAYPPPAFAPPSAPTGAPFGAPAVPGAPAGWTPPPKPGLVPLRPLTLGGILGASFQVLRRNPRPTFGFSLILNGIVGLLSLAVVGLVAFYAFNQAAFLSNASTVEQDQFLAGTVAQAMLAMAVPALLGVVTAAILQGIVSLEVARGTVGERLKLGGLWRQAKGRMGALIGWSFLLIGAIVVALVVIGLIVGVLVALGGAAGAAVGVILAVLAAAGLAVVGFWLGTRLSLVPSALMLERLSLRAAIARSWGLTVGFFWRVLGIQLLVAVILSIAAQVVTGPIGFIGMIVLGIVNPSGDENAYIVATIVVYIATYLLTVVVQAITSIVQSATTALIYIDLRMRKEGLDLDLTRFVEARQAGDSSISDPYLSPARPTATFGQQTAGGTSWS